MTSLTSQLGWQSMVIPVDKDFHTLDELVKHFQDVTSLCKVDSLKALVTATLTFYEMIFKKLKDPKTGDPLYVDPCSFLTDGFGMMSKPQLKTRLLELQAEVLEGTQHYCSRNGTEAPETEAPANLLSTVPPVPPPKGHSKHAVALWQLGYDEDCLVRGAPGSTASLDVLTSTLVGEREGLDTKRQNIDIIFSLGKPVEPDSEIQPFSVCISEGAATTCSCFLLIYFVIQFDLKSVLPHGLWESLCPRLLTNFVLYAHYEPAESLEKQVQTSIANKCKAADRKRPNILNMVRGFQLAARATPGSQSWPQTANNCPSV